MPCNVFNTEAEAIAAEAADYAAYIAVHSEPEAYAQQTTRWAIPQMRLDGKWVYLVCPEGSQDHTQEEYDPDWFEVGEGN